MRSNDSYNPNSGCGDRRSLTAISRGLAWTLALMVSLVAVNPTCAATEFSSFSSSAGEQVFSSEGGSRVSGAERAEQPAPQPEEKPPASDESSPPERYVPGKEKRAYSKEAIGYFNRGVELQSSGAFKKAIEQYRLAINEDDRLEEAYSNLGSIYFEMRNFGAAVKAFQSALVLNPNRPKTLNALGAAFSQSGRTAEALETWRKALVLEPKFASVYYNVGILLESKKNYQDARNAYFTACELDGSLADAKVRLNHLPKVKGQDNDPHSLLVSADAASRRAEPGQAEQAMSAQPSANQIRKANEVKATGPALLELATYSRAVTCTRLPVPLAASPPVISQQVLFCAPGDDPTQLAIPEDRDRRRSLPVGGVVEFTSGAGVGFDATKEAAQSQRLVASKRQTQKAAIREAKVAKPMIAMKPPAKQQAQIVANSDITNEAGSW